MHENNFWLTEYNCDLNTFDELYTKLQEVHHQENYGLWEPGCIESLKQDCQHDFEEIAKDCIKHARQSSNVNLRDAGEAYYICLNTIERLSSQKFEDSMQFMCALSVEMLNDLLTEGLLEWRSQATIEQALN